MRSMVVVTEGKHHSFSFAMWLFLEIGVAVGRVCRFE